MSKIVFNRASVVGDEMRYITKAVQSGDISGNGPFTKLTQRLLEEQLGTDSRVLLTTSCTHALEMAAILLDLVPGDEVIVPSYTFVSTALAFLMHGADIVFSDIREDTLNIDDRKLESLVTEKTRAIVPMHYAGVGCEMDAIMDIARRHDLVVIEDNAHGLYGSWRGKPLGTIGHMATQSFHGTKNISCGEGGAIVINDPQYFERAEIIREKGTNRAKFFRGQIDKYTWIDNGSSYIMSDILAAYLHAQVSSSEKIQNKRKEIWDYYDKELAEWADENNVSVPFIPGYCDQAYHMYYLIFPGLQERSDFISYMSGHRISVVFHYVPLHTSDIGRKLHKSGASLANTEKYSDRLVRLPLFYDMNDEEMERVVSTIREYKVA